MNHAFDQMYLKGAMIRLGDMLEYACLDCGYDPDAFWKMFICSGMARRFEVGDASVIAGRSGPELAYMILHEVDHIQEFPTPTWREKRSDLYWSGWVLAYFQWEQNCPFSEIWDSISIRMLQKLYRTFYEADLTKVTDVLDYQMKPPRKEEIRTLRLIRGLTQQELADRVGMSVVQLQLIESGVQKVEDVPLKTAIPLAKALGVSVETMK